MAHIRDGFAFVLDRQDSPVAINLSNIVLFRPDINEIWLVNEESPFRTGEGETQSLFDALHEVN